MKNAHLTRILCLVLVSLLAFLATACGETSESSSQAESGGTTSQTTSVEEDFVLFSNLPTDTYGGAEFTVLVEGDHMTTYASVEFTPQANSYTGLNTAITERNDLIEDRFDVKLVEMRTESSGAMVSTMKTDAYAGTSQYDMIMPYMSDAATLALEGCLYDLATLDNIHLTQSYYDQGSVSDLSISGKSYFVTGDLSLLSFACTHALVFNKSMVDEYGLENPYELVESGEWTIDKMWEMCRNVTSDTDGESGMSYKDTYGFLVNSNFITSMYIGAAQRLTSKNDADEPIIAITGEGPTRVYEKIYDFVNDSSAACQFSYSGNNYYTSAIADGKNIWTAATESVANGKALFRAVALIDIFDLGEYECSFGVLPTPKYTAEQDDYYSRVSTLYATCVAIPINAKNPEMSAVITDALMQASTDTTKEAYFDVILKSRKVQDMDSEEMLDIIFNGRVYDLASIYHWGGTSEYDSGSISGFMNLIAESGSNTFASTWQSIESVVQTAMDDTLDQYEMLE